jgi:hypothetical protein
MKPQPTWGKTWRSQETGSYHSDEEAWNYKDTYWHDHETMTDMSIEAYARYKIGDTLYVRESYAKNTGCVCYNYDYCDCGCPPYVYKASYDDEVQEWKWRPSIHMPKEVARIFLRVTDVWVERVQDITPQDAKAEGVCIANHTFRGGYGGDDSPHYREEFAILWDSINSKPKPRYKSVGDTKVIDYYVSYPWEDMQETRTYRGKDWYVCGNPWVFAYEFERVNK